MIWTVERVRRIVLDMAGQLVQKPHAGLPTDVPTDLDLFTHLGLDSLQRMELAARLNEFFGLFHTAARNYLLSDTAVDHWTTCILRARSEYDETITFRTSGTGGVQKAVSHPVATLQAEIQQIAYLFPAPTKVISTVGSHHIYGFLYTILLPAHWQIPLRLLADVTANDLDADTLIIGTPFTWSFFAQSLPPELRLSCRGITSTAPMPPVLFSQLLEKGLSLTEIYGSTETGGVAYRQNPNDAFTLLPHVDCLTVDPPAVRRSDTELTYSLPDRIEWVEPRTIRVLGRLDDAVQIAGVNVYPAHIRATIESCPLVAEADVHAKAVGGILQLFGAVRLRQHNETNRAACQYWIRERLSPAEIPKELYLY